MLNALLDRSGATGIWAMRAMFLDELGQVALAISCADYGALRSVLEQYGNPDDALPKTWSNRGDSLYAVLTWEVKMEIPVCTCLVIFFLAAASPALANSILIRSANAEGCDYDALGPGGFFQGPGDIYGDPCQTQSQTNGPAFASFSYTIHPCLSGESGARRPRAVPLRFQAPIQVGCFRQIAVRGMAVFDRLLRQQHRRYTLEHRGSTCLSPHCKMLARRLALSGGFFC